jgi:hypothetical protein
MHYRWLINTYFGLYTLLLLLLAACQATPPAPLPPTSSATPAAVVSLVATALPPTSTPAIATCADLDAQWGHNWPAALDTLVQLIAVEQNCGPEPLLSKKYAAHYIYGVALEEQGQLDQAIAQYRAALVIDAQRKEALQALVRLKALPKPTPPACLSTAAPRPDPAPVATPDTAQFVTFKEDQLRWREQPFTVKGVNYYPRQAPWQRFLSEARPAEMAQELDVIKKAGFNTLRIFLWYQPLFTCQPEDAIPNEDTFAQVDQLLTLARQRDLKVIVTLNDLPDLIFRPLYTDWAHYDNQTRYIIRRYRNEPAILAWDVRNEGDIDYGAQSPADAKFTQAEVVKWVAHVTELVREHDPHHLVTAGWWSDPSATAPHVDFLSFHYWTDDQPLASLIQSYRQNSAGKPLLLGEFGYSSWAESPPDQAQEKAQAEQLNRVTGVAVKQSLAGWVVWTAFDFVPTAGQPPHQEHFFGLWRVDLSPKPALQALPLQ